MQRSRARSAALASGFALLLSSTALTAPTVALAQAQAEVVQRIAVRGNERIEQATVLSYLPIQPGDRVDAAQLDLALKALYRTDLFADVRISAVGGEVIVEVV
ncbi:MAG: POTRA domain-containing protein, partial [Phenylobacterium sp.]|nr:POTRA domain-containing protein [Phenylobacterium sp.]